MQRGRAGLGHLGQRHVHEPADGEHALGRDGLGQLGHDLAADRVHRGTLGAGARGQIGVAALRRRGHEQLRDDITGRQRLGHRLRALGQEGPGPLAERPLAQLPGRLHPG